MCVEQGAAVQEPYTQKHLCDPDEEYEESSPPHAGFRVRFPSEPITSIKTRPRTLTADKCHLFWSKEDMQRCLLLKRLRSDESGSSSCLSDDEEKPNFKEVCPPYQMSDNNSELGEHWHDLTCDHSDDVNEQENEYLHTDFASESLRKRSLSQESSEEVGPHLLGSDFELDALEESIDDYDFEWRHSIQ
jgi:hypothetical protein